MYFKMSKLDSEKIPLLTKVRRAITAFNNVTSITNRRLDKYCIFTFKIKKDLIQFYRSKISKTFHKNLPKCFSYVVSLLYVYELPGYFQCELSKVCIDTGNWYILVSAEKLKNDIFKKQRSKFFIIYVNDTIT